MVSIIIIHFTGIELALTMRLQDTYLLLGSINMVEKNLDYSSKEYDDELNHEFPGRPQRCHYSNRKKQLNFEDYDLKALMDDYYANNDLNHQGIQ